MSEDHEDSPPAASRPSIGHKTYEERLIGYSADKNPFNDQNLHKPFVWKAKHQEKESRTGSGASEHHKKILNNQFEISKVRQSRLDRDFIKKVRDEENLRVQKHKDDEYHQQWKERINKLDKSQIYLRSKIRLENNKGRLIDWLAYIVSEDIIPEAQLEENSKKTADELINENISLLIDSGSENAGFVSSSNYDNETTVNNLIYELQLLKESGHGNRPDYWESLIQIIGLKTKLRYENLSIDQLAKIEDIIAPKTIDQLKILRRNIETKLECKDNVINVEYWESLLTRIDILLHSRIVKQISTSIIEGKQKIWTAVRNEAAPDEPLSSIGLNQEAIKCTDETKSNLVNSTENFSGQSLASCTLSLQEFKSLLPSATGLYLNEFRREFFDEFIDDFNEKLEGIKPKFFNIVTYIKNWNRYNQNKLEDESQPLPTSVHRYYFNIHYPLLSATSKAPYYELKRGYFDKETDESFALLVFHASAPYKPIIFKIVDKKWQTDWKHGYKCQFSNKFLTLSFRFWQLKYRK